MSASHQNNAWQQPAPSTSSSSSSRQPSASSRARDAQHPNVWTQRAAASNGSLPASAMLPPQQQPPVVAASSSLPSETRFNAAEVKAFLAREPSPAVYSLPESGAGGNGNGNGKGGGGAAWGAKANHTAANVPFFAQLAKQIAVIEGGG